MDWVPTALMLMTIALLTVQGLILLRKSRRNYYPSYPKTSGSHTFLTGVLNVVLALFAIAAFLLFKSGALILSPEYGVLFAQGTLAWFWAMATVMGMTVGFAWLLHEIRGLHTLASSRTALIGGGAVIALITILRARTLNQDEPAAFRIRCMDLWSYFFLAWIVTLLTLWILIVVYKSRMPWSRRMLGVVFALTLCGLVATFHATVGLVFAEDWTLPLWRATVLIGLPFVMGVLTWNSLKKRTKLPESSVLPLSAIAFEFGVLSSLGWTQFTDGFHSLTVIREEEYWCLAIWGGWAILLSFLPLADWWRMANQCDASEHRTPTLRGTLYQLPKVLSNALQNLPDIGHKGRTDDAVALVCFAIMAGSIIDLSHSARLDPIWDMAALIGSWLVLSEILAKYPLCTFMKDRLQIIRQDKHYLKTEGGQLLAALRWLLTPVRWLFSVEKSDTVAKVALFAVGKIALLIIIVIAVTQLPNAGKTVVLPFTSIDLDTTAQDKGKNGGDGPDASKELGRMVSERVANTIGVVGRDVRPLLLVADPKAPSAWIPISSGTGSDVQATFANSSLEIYGTKIPLSGVVVPIQEMARWMLRVRQITGSVQKQGNQYVLLASSSTGDTWRVIYSEPTEDASPKERQQAQKGAEERRGTSTKPTQGSQPGQSTTEPTSHAAKVTGETQPPVGAITNLSAIKELADNLAYNVIASDKKLHGLGITSVPKAMPDFSAGVEKWREFDASRVEEALTQSIVLLHDAVDKDPQFSVAYYRLGQAYLSDGQPQEAAKAFRESVRISPGFVAGHIALAETLYNLPDYYYQPPAAMYPGHRVTPYSGESRKSDQNEARSELQTVISELQPSLTELWRAAAYTGLCRDAFERQQQTQTQNSRYMAFFYCRRAEYLYSRLPSAFGSEPRIKDKETSVLARLGQLLNPYDEPKQLSEKWERFKPTDEEWRCDPDAVNEVQASRDNMPYNAYLKASQRYYELALSKAPGNAYLRCKYARVLTVDGNNEQMRALVNDEKAHLQMADLLQQKAADAYEASRRKLREASNAAAGKNFAGEEYSIDQARNEVGVGKAAYADALNEVGRAIDLAPFDAEALNTYAYYTWKWYWDAINFASQASPLNEAQLKSLDHAPGPSQVHVTKAIHCATQAMQITEDKGPRREHGVYQSSLGEVQLSAAKFDDAYQTLREIFYPDKLPNEKQHRNSDVSELAIYDEIRWDFAQAATCATRRGGSQSAREKEANEYLDTIRQHEKTREDQRFGVQLLKVPELQMDCKIFQGEAVLARREPMKDEIQFPKSY